MKLPERRLCLQAGKRVMSCFLRVKKFDRKHMTTREFKEYVKAGRALDTDEYMKFAIEVGDVSLRTEPGVLTMYAVGEKNNPCKISILETYASQAAYKKHIASEHFQQYKQGTLHMAKSLELADQMPLNPINRINHYIYD